MQFTLSAIAVLIYSSLKTSHQQKFCLGFFCPWRCLNDEISDRFSPAAVTEHDTAQTVVRDTILDVLLEALPGETLEDIILDDIHDLLVTQPQLFANFVVAGTSISSASANVRHSVVIIPQHTAFTSERSQALVSVSRSQGIQLVLAPPTCLKGFFRLALPLFAKQTGLLNLAGSSPTDLMDSLRQSKPTLVTPSEVSDNLCLDVPQEFNLQKLPPAVLLAWSRNQQVETCMLQLIISPAFAHPQMPHWAALGNRYMWAWRQLEPYFDDTQSRQTGTYYLLQFSTASRMPLFTLYLCSKGHRRPLAVMNHFQSQNGVLHFQRYYEPNLECVLRQATPDELLYHAPVGMPITVTNSEPTEATYPAMDSQEIADAIAFYENADDMDEIQDEDAMAQNAISFSFASIDPSSSSFLLPQVSTTVATTTVDRDFDQGQDEGNDDLVDVLKAIRRNVDAQLGTGVETCALFQAAVVCTPTNWACIRLPVDRLFLGFTDALFVKGLLSMSDTAALSQTPSALDLQQGFTWFLACFIVQFFQQLHDFPPFEMGEASGVKDVLMTAAFWQHQLKYAGCHRKKFLPPRFQLIRLLSVRSGNWKGVRSGFDTAFLQQFAPFASVVVFLPVQLALWIAGKVREKIELGQQLAPSDDFPAVRVGVSPLPPAPKHSKLGLQSVKGGGKTGIKGKERPLIGLEEATPPSLTNGKILKCQAKFTGLPFWPRTDSFPFVLNRAQQAYIKTYVEFKEAKNPKLLKTALAAQTSLAEREMAVPARIYEVLPPRTSVTIQEVEEEAADNYVANAQLSGPLLMHSYLQNSFVTETLQKPKHLGVVSDGLETELKLLAKAAFAPSPSAATSSSATAMESSGSTSAGPMLARKRQMSVGLEGLRPKAGPTPRRSSNSTNQESKQTSWQCPLTQEPWQTAQSTWNTDSQWATGQWSGNWDAGWNPTWSGDTPGWSSDRWK